MRLHSLKFRSVVVCALLALALPAQAAAHGRTATVALDYRLTLDQATIPGQGVRVRILDGDRDFRVVTSGPTVLVRGELSEPMLRIDRNGVWVNASSPTSTLDGIVSTGKHGWIRLSRGNSFAWHDHRLQPPRAAKDGLAGRFSVPIEVNGRKGSISGTFVRVARPPLWPWLALAVVFAAGIVLALRRRSLRAAVTVGVGTAAGFAALVEVTTFAVKDAPTGSTGWLQIGTAFVVAAVLAVLLVRLRGRARAHAAGVVGAVAAAVSLTSLPVFWHGVVISLLSPTAARTVCELAIVGGVTAAMLSFLPDFDEPVRVRPGGMAPTAMRPRR